MIKNKSRNPKIRKAKHVELPPVRMLHRRAGFVRYSENESRCVMLAAYTCLSTSAPGELANDPSQVFIVRKGHGRYVRCL